MAGCNVFNFKQFAINQDGCAMKVGTDGVLLGAWCRIDGLPLKALLDVGAGSGLIALQLAQRTDGISNSLRVDAIEIDRAAYEAAKRNFEASRWRDRLTAYCVAVQDFTTEMQYDHIVSNPPWFVDSLASPDDKRNLARHTKSLSYSDLMRCCFKLLAPAGRLSLIVPAGAETERMIAAAAENGLAMTRRMDVYSTSKSAPKRTLMEFSRENTAENAAENAQSEPLEHTSLVIENGESGVFSDEYRALTRDFYLKF